jgi:uncharacterized membrane protein YphA (DoxX/SURF4 family)
MNEPGTRRIRWSRLVAAVVAAGSFVVSGVSKFFDDQVTMPQLFEPLLGLETYGRVMLGLGALEIALAILLCLRWTRAVAAHGLLGLLLAFAVTVSLSARDGAFLDDCGCGDPVSMMVDTHDLWTMLLRLAGLAVAVVWAGIGAFRWRYLCGVCIATLAALLVAEKLAHGEPDGEQMVVARSSELRPGQPIPAIEVEAVDGRRRALADVLGAGSAAIVMSPDCEHCVRSMVDWGRIDDARHRDGGALVVLTSRETLARCREALDARGLERLPCYGLCEPGDARRLGVLRLPHYLEVGDDRRIALQTGSVAFRSLSRSLDGIVPMQTLVLGAARKVLGGEVSIATTGGAAQPGMPALALIDGQGRTFDAYLAAAAWRTSGSLELVVVVDRDGVVVGTHVLTYSFVEGGVGGMLQRLARIDGLPVTKAASLCASLVIAHPEVGVWPPVADILARIAASVAAGKDYVGQDRGGNDRVGK